MPLNNRSVQGPFIAKRMVFGAICTVLQRKSPGPEGLDKFDAMVKDGAFYNVNVEPERFEAPLPGVRGGTIAFQFVRHVNKAVKESKTMHAFTVAQSEFSMHFDTNLGKLIITGTALKPEKAFESKDEAERYLNLHTYKVKELDMTLGVANIAGDLVSMCRNDKKIVILTVLESVMGCVIKSPDLSLGGPIFQKLYFGIP
jgi:hypothetical protein